MVVKINPKPKKSWQQEQSSRQTTNLYKTMIKKPLIVLAIAASAAGIGRLGYELLDYTGNQMHETYQSRAADREVSKNQELFFSNAPNNKGIDYLVK